ncbi:MAG: NADPH:quinone reductase [Acidimicrobiaceae bacterium]|nr:NADPH:quinone reductase [Acidimicrobiaceae bacterium]
MIDEELGAPGRGQVLVDVLAAAANPADYKMYSGAFGRDPSKLPIRLGFEAAGVVAAVGEDAEGPAGAVHPGDDVIAYRIQGGYASQVMVPASAVVPKPSTLSFEEASGLLLTGATAAHALIATAVAAGDTVVVHGASGGVGSMAVQLAVIAGARVIATAGESSHAYLRQLGAQPVSYGDGLAERIDALADNGVDAAIDTVGTDEAIDTSIALVADRNRIATIAAFQRGRWRRLGRGAFPLRPAGPGSGVNGCESRFRGRRPARRRGLGARAGIPLVEAAAAHRELATGHTHGKIVLIP